MTETELISLLVFVSGVGFFLGRTYELRKTRRDFIETKEGIEDAARELAMDEFRNAAKQIKRG